MTEITINYWAVFIAAIAQMIIGFVYYSPAVLGKQWMKWGKMEEGDMKPSNMAKVFGSSFVMSLVTAYVLVHILIFSDAQTITMGMQGGFWVWLGFVATTTFNTVLYEKKPVKLYLLNNGYMLISLLVMGAILATWM